MDVVRTEPVPRSLLALGSLGGVDYADLFSVATDRRAAPERWARAMFGDVPNAGQLLIWGVVLGLRLSRGRSADTVAGWRIGGRGEDWVRLEAESWFLAANLVVRTGDGRVSLTTSIRYVRPVGKVLWPPLSAVHRSLIPGVLRGAVARVQA